MSASRLEQETGRSIEYVSDRLRRREKVYLKASSEAENKFCWVAEAVIEVPTGHVGVNFVQLLQSHGLIEVVLAVVDEPHSIQEALVRISGLILYRLPHVPAQNTYFNKTQP